MSRNNFLICLTGLPASGKSTFATTLKSHLEKRFSPRKVKIIDPDQIRNKSYPDTFDPKNEKAVRLHNLTLISDSLQQGYIVISDDLNYYSSMRHELKEIANKINLDFYIIYISTPLDTCLKWNKMRSTDLPDSVILNINDKFDHFNKYSWDTPLISIDPSIIQDLEEYMQNHVLNRLEPAEPLIPEDKPSLPSLHLKTRYHEKLDKITREITGDLLLNTKFQPLIKQILRFRKAFIKQHLNSFLDELSIAQSFKMYLETKLNLKLP